MNNFVNRSSFTNSRIIFSAYTFSGTINFKGKVVRSDEFTTGVNVLRTWKLKFVPNARNDSEPAYFYPFEMFLLQTSGASVTGKLIVSILVTKNEDYGYYTARNYFDCTEGEKKTVFHLARPADLKARPFDRGSNCPYYFRCKLRLPEEDYVAYATRLDGLDTYDRHMKRMQNDIRTTEERLILPSDIELPIHKCILIARSLTFKIDREKTSPQSTINADARMELYRREIGRITPLLMNHDIKIAKAIVSYMYTGAIHQSPSVAIFMKLLRCSSQYHINGLQDYARRGLIALMMKDNVLNILFKAASNGFEIMQEVAFLHYTRLNLSEPPPYFLPQRVRDRYYGTKQIMMVRLDENTHEVHEY